MADQDLNDITNIAVAPQSGDLFYIVRSTTDYVISYATLISGLVTAGANSSITSLSGLTTPLSIAQGGTGSTTAANARTALGLVIGTNVQAWDADLDTWAAKTPPSGTVVGTSDSQTLTNKTLTSPIINVTSDAQGDIYYRNGSGSFARLAPGTAGQFLKTNGAAANPSWATATPQFTAYKVAPSTAGATQTTASTSFVDFTSGTQSVVLSATSHVLAIARGNAGNSGSFYTYMQVTYDTGGSDTVVGVPGYSYQQEDHSISCGGIALSLGAGTYTFALMKKVSGGTGTYYDTVMDIIVFPA